ncbi:hypothetical protein ParKJ_10265 [Paraburkholderia fungorum]|uniref:Uncharacterized protein n=1 Tax=Paraburkholderia fungorum TaxID=134537 RepID=A0AAP5Q598_9BURK|nr:hypothetical protein [Paraburkholderia fungorum]MDT8837796.1 hypothetical protein [Paraburkholderia fungorum]
MTAHNAEAVLEQNWLRHKSGGIPESDLPQLLTAAEQQCLSDWIELASKRTGTAVQTPSLKRCVDLASWCRHGTDTLTDVDYAHRTQMIESAARRFDVPENVLKILATSTLNLEQCFRSTR